MGIAQKHRQWQISDMTAYSFQRQFVDPILAGTKVQTIRADRRGRNPHVRPGGALQLYTAMRTKHCAKIGDARCSSIQPIRIEVENAMICGASGNCLTTIDELDDFARRDGFHDWIRMRLFWQQHHPTTPVFTGVLIHWREFKPA